MAVVGEHAGAQRRAGRRAPRNAARSAPPPSGSLPPAAESAPSVCTRLDCVGDADEALGQVGDDLLARQRRAAALDHVAAAVDLVGAVDVDRRSLDLVRVEHADAVRLQPLGALAPSSTPRRGSCRLMPASASMKWLTVEPVPTPTMLARHHVVECGAADQGLEFVLGHGAGLSDSRRRRDNVAMSACMPVRPHPPVPVRPRCRNTPTN